MIVFDLICSMGHTFEGWFDSGEAFEKQQQKGQISCPICDDTAIEKKLSTFGIKNTSPKLPHPVAPPTEKDLEQLSRRVTEYVDKNFDDVGSEFTKEALKIHYGVSEPRNIRGVSTDAEEKVLKDEGIDFIKIPVMAKPATGSESEE